MPRERAAIVSSLTSKGFSLKQGERDHDFLVFSHEGQTRGLFTKISRGSGYKVYGDELLARMSKQLQVTRAQLNELIDCSLDELGYVSVLRSRGIICDTPRRKI